MNIQELIRRCYEEYLKNGFFNFWDRQFRISGDLAELGLVTTEISEGLECIRKEDYEHLGEELADIIIRVVNFANRKDIDIESELIKKIFKNSKREYKHGKANI